MSSVPSYLEHYADQWREDPHKANMQWFANAKWGLFLHYGLYSQLGRGEWALYQEKIPLAEYEKLVESFRPDKFDADFITDLALEAGMSYVNLTACHHEGFCLWKSDVDAYNSYTYAKRDLVRELAEQCEKKKLGFFAYYTHIINWRHPYMPSPETLPMCRPDYPRPESRYQYKEESDYKKFWEYAHACMTELLELEYPLAGMWLDIIASYYQRPDLIPVEDTYKLIRSKRPEALLSFKQGATGTEDYASPEYSFKSLASRMGNPESAALADRIWEINRHKHNEICMTLQHKTWGYNSEVDHFSADDVWSRLAYALKNNCNMLANTGPFPDGSIHHEDVKTLREVGRRIRKYGWPKPEDAIDPAQWAKPADNGVVIA